MGFNFPNAPSIGQVFPSTPAVGLPQWIWDGSAWLLKSNASGPTIYISDTPPTPALDNSLWWRSDLGIMYVRYRDVDGAQWVTSSLPQAGPQGPPGQWTQITQAAYNALSPPNPTMLYVIIG